jgi:hypothetical protein
LLTAFPPLLRDPMLPTLPLEIIGWTARFDQTASPRQRALRRKTIGTLVAKYSRQ